MSSSWLDRGHGDGLGLTAVASEMVATEVAVTGLASGSWRSARRGAVVAIAATAVLLGLAGTVYAVRETLFPTLGAPTARSVWQNPVPADQDPTVETSTNTTSTVASTVATTTASNNSSSPTATVNTSPDTSPETSDNGGGSSVPDSSGPPDSQDDGGNSGSGNSGSGNSGGSGTSSGSGSSGGSNSGPSTADGDETEADSED